MACCVAEEFEARLSTLVGCYRFYKHRQWSYPQLPVAISRCVDNHSLISLGVLCGAISVVMSALVVLIEPGLKIIHSGYGIHYMVSSKFS